jgi:uncharacterized protein
MTRLPWTPWREALTLREDVRSGELSLKIFAADLYDVVMDTGPAVYRDPAEFFALTYPTYALRVLAHDVMVRLAGKSDKAIRQLELTAPRPRTCWPPCWPAGPRGPRHPHPNR